MITYNGWFVVVSVSVNDEPPLGFDGPYDTKEEADAHAENERFDGQQIAQVIYGSLRLAEPVKIHRED